MSTPLTGDYTTVCNGGIIAGDQGVLIVEAFQTPEGSRWIAEKARDLTGQWPTHVLVTHYHGDHSSGVAGFHDGEGVGPSLHVTATTRMRKIDGFTDDVPGELRSLWNDVVFLNEDAPETLDLGGRLLKLIPRFGHTASDVTVELEEEGITWCGDLVWNGMFPNYMDAVPSRLSRAVRRIQAGGSELFVPGHGPLAGSEELASYVAVIDGIEETARTARREGWTSDEAAARHTIPENLGEWTLFNPSYFQRAVEAWMKEWGSPNG
jgi:glyoxylase-like metal-dependent hydrolase (beta-lactamase superfamily II)